ncbi:unnamed protein product [Meloidogyne enterolobii]|uniref:Uncharacterized protein n=2 Tax=Meloidogyne enterolobii TaxID=390850 RepID=A0A6V7Y6D9_MELEN|nr:unnamed protein product [Meloidogyne enterolobii]
MKEDINSFFTGHKSKRQLLWQFIPSTLPSFLSFFLLLFLTVLTFHIFLQFLFFIPARIYYLLFFSSHFNVLERNFFLKPPIGCLGGLIIYEKKEIFDE